MEMKTVFVVMLVMSGVLQHGSAAPQLFGINPAAMAEFSGNAGLGGGNAGAGLDSSEEDNGDSMTGVKGAFKLGGGLGGFGGVARFDPGARYRQAFNEDY